jgi:putative pyoverdin transport system ATP-binding/permease protein
MSKLIKLIFFSETGEVNNRALYVLLTSSIAGAAYAGLAAIINEVAEEVMLYQSTSGRLSLFLLALMALLVTKWLSLSSCVVLTEKTLEEYRNRVGDMIRRSELMQIETMDKGEIYTKLTMDAKQIARSFTFGVKFFQALVTIAIVFCYIFSLSLQTGVFLTLVFLLGVGYFRRHSKKIDKIYHESFQAESELFEDFGNVLDGFKELKLNVGKKQDFFKNHLRQVVEKAKKLRVSVGNEFAIINVLLFVALFYISLGYILFILSKDMPFTTTFKIIAAFAFIWEPVNVIYISIPEIVRGNVSAERLTNLKDKLAVSLPAREILTGKIREFKKIACEKLYFEYPGKQEKEAFSVGPIDLTVNQGEIVFLTGGNGCGKSTLLKLLAGLYEPSGGAFFIDESQAFIKDQRHLFSVVFTDCHLFDDLYGMENVSGKRARELISLMGLDDKTAFENGRIRHFGLSTGQAKRLALVVALLEDKPVYIFDEWAAEQDPQFRKTFYEGILPSLKSQGKTIVAATHDDRYFHVADHVVKMDYGKIQQAWDNPL